MKTLFILPIILAAFSGCSTNSVNSIQRDEPLANKQVVVDRRIITDRTLSNTISILDVAEGYVSGDILKIQVTLLSNSRKNKTINYIFEWFDQNGMIVNSPTSGWKSINFSGKEQKSVSAIAPNSKVVDFVIKIKEPNK